MTEKKKHQNQNIPEDQSNSGSDTSEEWRNFERGVKQILSLPPEEAKRIREKYSPKGRRKKKPDS
jgi:hypothetical protein